MPTGPTTTIIFNAVYENLPAIVQRFAKYFFRFVIVSFKGVSFTGLLGATIFAGAYELPSGDVEKFFITDYQTVPGPEVGTGLSSLVVGVIFWLSYVLYRRRTIPE